MSVSGRALVLGGGGVAGIAWETGVLAGLAEHGVDVLAADRIVGTSAGSTVAAQITAGPPLSDLLARQIDPARHTPELDPGVPVEELQARFERIHTSTSDPVARLRAIGAMALQARTVSEAERRAVIEARLPGIDARLARQICQFMQQVRRMDLDKLPGTAETLDWARALVLMHVDALEPEVIEPMLGLIVKTNGDVQRLRRALHDGELVLAAAPAQEVGSDG